MFENPPTWDDFCTAWALNIGAGYVMSWGVKQWSRSHTIAGEQKEQQQFPYMGVVGRTFETGNRFKRGRKEDGPEKAETTYYLVLLCLEHTIRDHDYLTSQRTALYKHGYPNMLPTQKGDTKRGASLMKAAVALCDSLVIV
jgi:hypothetical protein